MEGVHSNYETTLIRPIIDFIAELAGKEYIYESQEGYAMRVVADHARTTAFSIADGILPGNEGRAYVLRKIMRRAIYHGREHLNFHEAFFYKVCDFVVEQMRDAYPELDVQREFIGKMVRIEEERFGATMTVGLSKLGEAYQLYLDECADKASQTSSISGTDEIHLRIAVINESIDKLKYSESESAKKFGHRRDRLAKWMDHWRNEYSKQKISNPDEKYIDSFDYFLSEYAKEIKSPQNLRGLIGKLAKLYDTFGTPKDLIRVFLENQGIELSEEDFSKKIDNSISELQASSEIGKTKQKENLKPIYVAMERTSVRSNFHGYDRTDFENSKVVAIVKDDQQINELNEGDEGLIVLSETPFYAESGGQVGDTGFLTNENSKVKVQDTFAPVKDLILHKSKVEKGSVKVGDELTATVDVDKRDATRRNHTATHLVHAALREVLGTHVKQAGSVVAPQFLRFDFTHYQPISNEEIRQIEDLVNHYILQNEPVTTNVMAIEEAMQTGAMALFGEKYGSAVRVLSVGGGTFSKELCGGTHVRATGDIGSFKIISDEAIASGVRRIRAITGFDAFERFREDERLIADSLNVLKAQRDNLPNAIEKLQEELKRTKRENDDLKMKIATGAIGSAASNGDEARDVNGVKVIAKTVEGLDKSGMRHLSDTLMAKIKSGVVILARTEEDKVSFIVRVSDDLTNKVKAGEIVKQIAPIVGGRGGGKADMAEGGGTDAGKINDALEASYKAVEQMLR